MLLLVLVVALQDPTGVVAKGVSVEWAKLAAAVHEYGSSPSTANAGVVLGLLPRDGGVRFGERQDTGVAEEFYRALQSTLPTLQRLLDARDRGAARVGFAMRSVCDGGLLEDLDKVLAHLVRRDPELFLEQAHQHALVVAAVTADDLIDNPKGRCDELRLRVEVLRGVGVKRLREARDAALLEVHHAMGPIPGCR